MINIAIPARSIFIATMSHTLGVAITVSLLAISAGAQSTSSTDGSTPLGIAPGAPVGSYALSGFDNINLYNGKLNFHLPLLHVVGRGGAQYTMTLPIEQRWRVIHAPGSDPQTCIEFADANWWAGLEPGYGPGVLQARFVGEDLFQCSTTIGDEIYTRTLTRLTFTAADGTEYELRDQLTGGQILQNTCPRTGNQPRGTVFVTADGTAATFISDFEISDEKLIDHGTYDVSGYLMLRDGTRYRFDGGLVSWLRDRSGNRLTFTYDEFARVKTSTDSLNRLVTICYAFSADCPSSPNQPYDEISFKGFGGATRTIRVWHANLSEVLRSDYRPTTGSGIQSTSQLFPELGPNGGLYNELKVSSVELPGGRRYRFYYNPYGELARVELPTGGAFEYDPAPGSGVLLGGGSVCGPQDEIYRRVMKRRVYPDGVTAESEAVFTDSYDASTTYVVVDHLNHAGGVLAREKHYFFTDARQPFLKRESVIRLGETGASFRPTNSTPMARSCCGVPFRHGASAPQLAGAPRAHQTASRPTTHGSSKRSRR